MMAKQLSVLGPQEHDAPHGLKALLGLHKFLVTALPCVPSWLPNAKPHFVVLLMLCSRAVYPHR